MRNTKRTCLPLYNLFFLSTRTVHSSAFGLTKTATLPSRTVAPAPKKPLLFLPEAPKSLANMSRIISLPISANTADRISQANMMKELLELLPIPVKPPMTELCEMMYRIAHKAASVGAQLDDLKAKANSNQLPSAIHARPVKVQVCKEYASQSQFVSAERALERAAVAHAQSQLASWIDIKENEFRHLYGLASKAKITAVVNKIVTAHKEGYRRFLVVPTVVAPTPSPFQ